MDDSDEMDWQWDKSPIVYYKSNQPFGRAGVKRTIHGYAEGQQLENGRPGVSTLRALNSPHHARPPPPQAQQAFRTTFNIHGDVTTSAPQGGLRQYLDSRRPVYGEHGKAWRYLCNSIDTFGYGIHAVCKSETVRMICYNGYRSSRSLLTSGPLTIRTFDVLVQCSNSAKRRVISLTRRYSPPSADGILLSPKQRRLLRYRERALRCDKHRDQSITQGVPSPNPLAYCMSGALQPIEPPTSPTQDLRVPGAWVDSPRWEPTPPRSLAVYDPKESDDVSPDHELSDESAVVKSIALTNPCATCETPVVKSKWPRFMRAKSRVTKRIDGDDQVTSDPSETDTEKLYPGYDKVLHGRVKNRGRPVTGPLKRTVIDKTGKEVNAAQLSPISAFDSDHPSVLAIQREWARHSYGVTYGCPARPAIKPAKLFAKRQPKPPTSTDLGRKRRALRIGNADPDVGREPASPQKNAVADPQSKATEDNSSLLSSPPSSTNTRPNAVRRRRAKRVAFFKSPQTGRPVSRIKTYVEGSRVDEYSSPANNDIYDGLGALFRSPTFPEQIQQMKKAQQPLPVTPPNKGHVRDPQYPSPSEQLLSPESVYTPEATSTVEVGSSAFYNSDGSDDVNGQSSTPPASTEDGISAEVPSQSSPATPSTATASTPANTPQSNLPANPVTPEQVALEFQGLELSGRRAGLRSTSRAESEDRRRIRKGKEEAEEKARKKQEAIEARKKSGARRMPIGTVIEPLPADWERKVNQALSQGMTRSVATSISGTDILRRSIGKVLPQPGTSDDPSGWLNDEIIAAYLEIVVAHGLKASGYKRSDGKTPTMHAFNSYFYENLSTRGLSSISRWAKRAKIGEENLLDVERVFIPVNVNESHWTLLVVSPKFRLIEYFDSFHGQGTAQVNNAKKWLAQELGEDLYKEEEWTVITRAGPKQNNGVDCGVFVSTTAKMVMLGVEPMAYSWQDIPTQRRRIVAELMNCGFEGELAPNVVFEEDE